jgi:hypothetical protein
MLVRRSGDDGIDFAAEGESGYCFDGVPGDSARADDAAAVEIALAGAEIPAAHRDTALGGDCTDLILRADHHDLGINRTSESAGGNLGADASWITECDREPRTT